MPTIDGQRATATCKQCAHRMKYESEVGFNSMEISEMMTAPCAGCGKSNLQLTFEPLGIPTSTERK